MSKKLVLLISFILTLGMTSVGSAGLEGYWPLDGDLLDASGNGRHGTWMGDPNAVVDPNSFESGAAGLGIVLNGVDEYVNIDGYKGIGMVDGVQQEFSVANWFKITETGGNHEMVTWGTSAGRTRLTWRVHQGRLRTEHGSGNLRGNTYVNDGEWHHGALVVTEGANLRVPATRLYVDGVEDTIFSGSDNPFELGTGADVSIGRRADNGSRYWPGSLDEVYIFSRVLDADQVAGVMNGELPSWPKADRPSPADGTMIEEVSVTLAWRGGMGGVARDVYFGTTPDLGPDQLVAPQLADTQHMVFGVEADKTYYWRIDETDADGNVTTGDVWSIWTPPGRAYNPSPGDGKAILDTTVALDWSGGWSPIMHATYFGTNADEVANAVGAAPAMDIGFDSGELQPGTTYYWRVDEFYGTAWVKGPVWSFSTVPVIPLTEEPNLVAEWTMDDAAGGVVLDMSGNANHALALGGVQVVDGAMEFDGIVGTILEVPDASLGIFDPNGSEFTAVMSINPSRLLSGVTNHNISNVLLSRGSDPFNDNFEFGISAEGNGMIYTDTDVGDSTRVVGDGEITIGEWHQVVVVYDANAIDIYLDGIRYSTQVTGVFFDQAAGSQFTIGDSGHEENPYGGLIDDVKIFDKAMTPEDVRQTYGDVALAYDADPAAGSVDIDVAATTLSWAAGDGAAEHDVYVGTDKAAVAAADASDASGIYRGRQAGTTYAPGILDFGTKHYWRIDEVAADGVASKGKVWSFTTANEIVIYDVETPADYDNTADPFVSQLALDLDPAQNWAEPIGRVAISYTGNAAPGSVAVDDANGTTTITGRGADIWGTADEFQYAYTTLTGDGSMTVKVDSLAFTDPWTKAGIMIRETLDAGSSFAMVAATGVNGVRFQARAMADQDATSDTSVATDEQKALNAPVWIKIERAFPMINAYYSTDGVTFTPMSWNPQVIPMSPAPIYIGL
ncbi:MAG: LamG-like jellyroll fold domain-containing protein, partial [Planctomycetota bacterium]